MAPPIDKRTLKAAALLSTPHPKHPERFYSISEAAKKTGVARSTIYRHIKPKAAGDASTKDQADSKGGNDA